MLILLRSHQLCSVTTGRLESHHVSIVVPLQLLALLADLASHLRSIASRLSSSPMASGSPLTVMTFSWSLCALTPL